MPIDRAVSGMDARDGLTAATLMGDLTERDSVGWTYMQNDTPILPLCSDEKHWGCLATQTCMMKHQHEELYKGCRKFRVRVWTQVEKLEDK